jgi:hypothetical protein
VEDTPLKLLLDVAEVRTTEEAAKVERKTSTKRQRAGPPSQLEIPPILF